MMNINKVAVFGAGAMGAGIAHALAMASTPVFLLDVNQQLVEKGLERIRARCASDVKRGKLSDDDMTRVLGLVEGAVDQWVVKDVDLAIEAVIEDRDIKGKLFGALTGICGPETIFATNTSTLSVTDLASLSGRPERFTGLHFFNPVHVMRLVEIVPGFRTDKEIISEMTALVKSMKKFPAVVQDCPGFLVNRIQLAYMNEAMLFVQRGVSPELIDAEAKKVGFPMGPMELVDMLGIDVDCHVWPIMHKAYAERFPVPILSQKLCDAGRLGLKTGKGIYSEGKIDDEFSAIVKSIAPSGKALPFSIESLVLRQVNEAVYCLQEGVASAEEIDRAMVLGTGFPNHEGIGGPLHWADEKGLDWVLSTLEELEDSGGERFWPHHLLKTYVAAGNLGRKTGKGFFEYQ